MQRHVAARHDKLLFSCRGRHTSFDCDWSSDVCSTNLYRANRNPGPIVEAACWAHGRRKFFDLARLSKAPIAADAVKRIDALFAIEREINGLMPQEHLRDRKSVV